MNFEAPNQVNAPCVSSTVTENQIKTPECIDRPEFAVSYSVGVCRALPQTKSASEIVVEIFGSAGKAQVSSESCVIIIY